MNVQPIHRLKDIRAIKKLIADSPRDFAIFAIGVNTNLRACYSSTATEPDSLCRMEYVLHSTDFKEKS